MKVWPKKYAPLSLIGRATICRSCRKPRENHKALGGAHRTRIVDFDVIKAFFSAGNLTIFTRDDRVLQYNLYDENVQTRGVQ